MATRRVPDRVHANRERWSDQDVQHFQTYIQLALNHSYGRNARVVQVLCYLSLIRSVEGLSPAQASVSVSAAEFQNYRASRGDQAAHYLPGQL